MKNSIITTFLVVIVLVLTSFTYKQESSPLIQKVSNKTAFKIQNVKMSLNANASIADNKKTD